MVGLRGAGRRARLEQRVRDRPAAGDQPAQRARVAEIAEQRRAAQPPVAHDELAVALAPRVERDHLLGQRRRSRPRGPRRRGRCPRPSASSPAPRRGTRPGGPRSPRPPRAPARAPAPTARRPCRGARRTRRPPTRRARSRAGCRRRARRAPTSSPASRASADLGPDAGGEDDEVGGQHARRRPSTTPSSVTASVRRPHSTSMPSARIRRSSSRAASGSSWSSISRSARWTTVTVDAQLAQAARRLEPEQPAADHDRASSAPRRPRGSPACRRSSGTRARASRPATGGSHGAEPVASTSASYGQRRAVVELDRRARACRPRAPPRRAAASRRPAAAARAASSSMSPASACESSTRL